MYFTKKIQFKRSFLFWKCQEPVRRETTEGSSAIGFHSTSKMAAQSYSRGINQQKSVSAFFDILIGCLDI